MTKEQLIERLRAMYVANGTNYVQAAADKLEAQAQYIRQLEDAVTPELVTLRARVADYETRLTAVMPADFKDWHENSRAEWPEIAAWVITNQREQLTEIAKTEPVGAIYTIAGVQHCTITETMGDTDLFARPMPAQGVNAGPMGCAWTQDPDFELKAEKR